MFRAPCRYFTLGGCGKVEMRGKVDLRKGAFPAWWAMGDFITPEGVTVVWPGGNEIDMLEYAGKHGWLKTNYCIHSGGDESGSTQSGGECTWENRITAPDKAPERGARKAGGEQLSFTPPHVSRPGRRSSTRGPCSGTRASTSSSRTSMATSTSGAHGYTHCARTSSRWEGMTDPSCRPAHTHNMCGAAVASPPPPAHLGKPFQRRIPSTRGAPTTRGAARRNT